MSRTLKAPPTAELTESLAPTTAELMAVPTVARMRWAKPPTAARTAELEVGWAACSADRIAVRTAVLTVEPKARPMVARAV